MSEPDDALMREEATKLLKGVDLATVRVIDVPEAMRLAYHRPNDPSVADRHAPALWATKGEIFQPRFRQPSPRPAYPRASRLILHAERTGHRRPRPAIPCWSETGPTCDNFTRMGARNLRPRHRRPIAGSPMPTFDFHVTGRTVDMEIMSQGVV